MPEPIQRSNFGFIRQVWPEVFGACLKAESYVHSDPGTALIQARRAVEILVDKLYEVYGLQLPYQSDLSAMTNAPEFRNAVNLSSVIANKLRLIRISGNDAVHNATKVASAKAIDMLGQLYDVAIWAAFNHSVARDSVPTGSKFDPQLATQVAALNPAQRAQLVAGFAAQQKQWAERAEEQAKLVQAQAQQLKAQGDALTERAAAISAKDAEIAALLAEREQMKAKLRLIKNESKAVDTHDYNEETTRVELIDALLREAGWALNGTRDREYQVSGMPITGDNPNGNGFVDYVLWGDDGKPLAVVEAKRTGRSAHDGQHQAKLYADALKQETGFRPVIMYSNGDENWLWDDAAFGDQDGYPPRQIHGFPRKNELELMVQRRATRADLNQEPINLEIAGKGRPYQQRAIRAIDEAFMRKQRKALLVMATGSGKTRTVVALVDQLAKAGWVKNVLFLADRTALVRQATKVFLKELPSSNPVNLVEHPNGTGRVYLSTYPTMINLINKAIDAKDSKPGSEIATKFGPEFFDLVIIDEAHRSVYEKYGAIFTWFHSLLVGLTATPKDEVDRNTYGLFDLEDGVPTDSYELNDAVAQGFLVPPRAIDVGTTFLRQGISYDQLSPEERDIWDSMDWGDGAVPPAEVGAEEINRFLFNKDTVEKVLDLLMREGHKVDGGQRLAKTIIFAKNQEHAEFIQKVFDEQYPEYGGNFAAVITHSVSHNQSLIDNFEKPNHNPIIAISVDMLDTGIDVPQVANLVFFKTVRSKTKFWQMIGRGTRLCPDLYGPGQDKQDFYVFDFCGNFEYFNQPQPEKVTARQPSLTERVIDARVQLLQALDAASSVEERKHLESTSSLRQSTAAALHQFIAGMNLNNFTVRPHRALVERFANPETWATAVTDKDAAEVSNSLASLPSSVREPDTDALRFDLLMMRGQIARLTGDGAELDKVRRATVEIADALLATPNVPVIAEQLELLEQVASDDWWVDVTPSMLELARVRLRSLVKLIEKTKRAHVYTDFEDTLGEAKDIVIGPLAAASDLKRFKDKVKAFILQHEDNVTVQRLRRNKQLTSSDLDALEQMLTDAGLGSKEDIEQAAASAQGFGLFLRSLVGLEPQAVQLAFSDFLENRQLSPTQHRFVDQIIEELTNNGAMEFGRLYEAPYSGIAPQGPDLIFTDPELDIIADIIEKVTHTAIPPVDTRHSAASA